jgi:hypothetical protein
VRGVTHKVTERFDGRPFQLFGQAVSRLIMVSFPSRGSSREEESTMASTQRFFEPADAVVGRIAEGDVLGVVARGA